MRHTFALSCLVALALVACGRSTPELDVQTPGPGWNPPAAGSTPPPPLPSPAIDAPTVIAVDPPNGARAVDPSRTTLSVTFDRPMDPQGWAWVTLGDATAPDIEQGATFDEGLTTNTTRVRLEPGRDYVIMINSPEYQYFKDQRGVPATPYRWEFSTRGERSARLIELPGEAPQIVALDPPDGATGVDPAQTTLSVTFDRPMLEGWSWVVESGQAYPETVGPPAFDSERLTNRVAVELEPGTSYVVWLNSQQYQMFQSAAGVPLAPFRWTFTTRPGTE